jgi:3-phosphoglycerate kinase
MKQLSDFDFKEKTALIRCDFNVSFSSQGEILDDYRMEAPIATIKHLLEKKAKIVLINHFTGLDNETRDVSLIKKKIEEIIKKEIHIIQDVGQKKKVEQGSFGDVFFLPNIRKDKREEENSFSFAQEIASLGDIYVNEAFSVCHRNHASLVELAGILPSCAGLWLVRETEILSKAFSQPSRPLVIIVGGTKVDSKVKVLDKFLEKSDHLLLGGKLVNEILVIKRMIATKEPLSGRIVNEIKKIDLTSPKMHFPLDVVVSSNSQGDFYTRITGPGLTRKDESIFDIGPETIDIYSRIISEAKMIVWAGPLGLFEEKKFEKGTREIARVISLNEKAFKIVGGGDTGVALSKFNLRKGIDHVSTGGGAMLEFLSGNQLPGLKALDYYN